MSEPDIIRPIGNGKYALVWIASVEVPRQEDDSFRIQIPLRASLCDMDGVLETDGEGNEISVKCPISSINAPFMDYAHHPEVQALYTQLRDVSLRIARGDLAPTVPAQEATP